jgi:hypothetical protein
MNCHKVLKRYKEVIMVSDVEIDVVAEHKVGNGKLFLFPGAFHNLFFYLA